MPDLKDRAEPAVRKLLQSEPDQLYEQLGMALKAIEQEPQQAGLFITTLPYDAEFAGPMDVVREIGQDFFRRFSQQAYNLVCGTDGGSAGLRDKIVSAFAGGATSVAAALTAAFVSAFGWAPAIAALVAALAVNLFFKPLHGATCDAWKKRLPTPAAA
jgi:hypothetical protein